MDSFETVYRQHFASVFRLAMSLVGRRDLAEDLTADSFLELHRHFGRIQLDQLPAWLFVVVRNAARDHWRRERVRERHARWVGAAPPPFVRPPSGPLWCTDDRLAAKQRICLELHYVWGYTVAEIAGRLGLTDGQVKGHLQRAREVLREVARSRTP